MGLLGRIGKEWGEQAANGSRVRDLVGGPPALAGIGAAALGAPVMALDAANGSDNPFDRAGEAATLGAMGMGGLGALAAGTMGMKQLVIALARAMKQKAPEAADDMVIGQAQKMAMAAKANPDARAQIERIIGKINWDQ